MDVINGDKVPSMKTCPVCKKTLFSDMGICYNCMYEFGSNPELEARIRDSDAHEVARSFDMQQSRQNIEDQKTSYNPCQKDENLFGEFLEEFQCFLGKFLLDRKISIK